VSLRVTQPLFYDSYRRNRTTGSFILASEDTNVTVGAGMILGPGLSRGEPCPATWCGPGGSPARSVGVRSDLRGPPSGSRGCRDRGSRRSPAAVEGALVKEGRPAYRLDGDNIRCGIEQRPRTSDRAGRDENVRRVAEVALLFADTGVDDPYEAPEDPELELRPDVDLNEAVERVLRSFDESSRLLAGDAG
jgi:bifunctional enzyme CysN/CysC